MLPKYLLPVDEPIDEGGDVVRAPVLHIKIISMLPALSDTQHQYSRILACLCCQTPSQGLAPTPPRLTHT